MILLPQINYGLDTVDWANPLSEDPLNDGLVAWYLGGGLGWGSNKWFDISRYGNHGTLTNMDPATDWVGNSRPGGYGALDFDGTNDYVQMGNAAALDFDGTTPFSGSAWVYMRNVIAQQHIIGKIRISSPYTGWNLEVRSYAIRVILVNAAPANYIAVSASTTGLINTWVKLDFTYDGSKTAAGIKIYVNGLPSASGVSADTLTGSMANSYDFQIAARDGANTPFNGQIDDVRIYNRASLLTKSNRFTSIRSKAILAP